MYVNKAMQLQPEWCSPFRYVCMCVCMYVCNKAMQLRPFRYVCMHVYMRMETYMLASIHNAYIHTSIHNTYIHTYIQAYTIHTYIHTSIHNASALHNGSMRHFRPRVSPYTCSPIHAYIHTYTAQLCSTVDQE